MTTEDDFQSALDANPEDWQTRLVLADWLDEHNDARAEGYRALAALRARPHPVDVYWWANETDRGVSSHSEFNLLPADWFELTTPSMDTHACHCSFETRRAAEDAAARAFARLPEARRAELFSSQPNEARP